MSSRFVEFSSRFTFCISSDHVILFSSPGLLIMLILRGLAMYLDLPPRIYRILVLLLKTYIDNASIKQTRVIFKLFKRTAEYRKATARKKTGVVKGRGSGESPRRAQTLTELVKVRKEKEKK